LLDIIDQCFQDLKSSVNSANSQRETIRQAADAMAQTILEGGTIFICGNGGSAAEAQHFAAEFVGRFLLERPGLPALSLAADTSKLTAIGNDYGYQEVFARQLRALGRPKDLLWALSTSGTSPNVLEALKAAREKDIKSVFMCGKELASPPDTDIIIYSPAPSTPRIQELHLFYGHLICQLVDHIIFSPQKPKVSHVL
jgi:D-sedoheptulose 7-phosphate isomerase